MMEILLVCLLGLALLTIGAAVYILQTCAERRQDKLLAEISSLREDNRALTEALVRSEGKPMIFRPPVKEKSAGWFDSRSEVIE